MQADLDVTEDLVLALLQQQHPDLTGRPLTPLAHGWDNVLFRLGTDLVVRLPRRAEAAPLLETEQRWLPEIADSLPLPVPAPVRTGRPGCGYPWAWSVLPWLEGRSAVDAPFDQRVVAEGLAGFLRAMHRPAPADAPRNAFRGIPLQNRDALTVGRFALLADQFDPDALTRSWTEALDAPRFTGPPRLLHGDMHPGNLLVNAGRLSGVIDFGDLCAGDPATDLGVAWMLFDAAERTHFLDLMGADHDTRMRARGWALTIAVAIAATPGPTPLTGVAERTIVTCLGDSLTG